MYKSKRETNERRKRKMISDAMRAIDYSGFAEKVEVKLARACEENAVNHPTHYQGKNECIDVMIAMFGKEAVRHFCMCNAYKYRFRATMKNGDEDIKKAEWYETKLIELGGRDES